MQAELLAHVRTSDLCGRYLSTDDSKLIFPPFPSTYSFCLYQALERERVVFIKKFQFAPKQVSSEGRWRRGGRSYGFFR